jgi:hypothetical protein
LKTIEKGSEIFRARKNKAVAYTKPDELGPPKPEECIYANRMSPAGIPMFYGSFDIETCIAELGNTKGDYSIAKWETQKILNILDFTKHFKYSIQHHQYFYEDFPSIFDKDRRDFIFDYRFILRLASDISAKVEKDGTENIDYVPTQVIAEYIRKIVLIENKHIDGICFYSSQNGGKNITLFFDQKACLDINGKDQALKLLETKVVSI